MEKEGEREGKEEEKSKEGKENGDIFLLLDYHSKISLFKALQWEKRSILYVVYMKGKEHYIHSICSTLSDFLI